MADGEPNLFALAADLKHLSETVDDMSTKADARWETQQKILVEIANNKSEMKHLLRRLTAVEVHVESLNIWRWRTVGVFSVIVVLLEGIFKLF